MFSVDCGPERSVGSPPCTEIAEPVRIRCFPQAPEATQEAAAGGMGEGHAWGEEETMWDYAANVSFRGCKCRCGARLKIT